MQISKRFRNGIVLMYDGDISDFANRTSDLTSDLNLKHWYCMNGKVSNIPNLIDKYPRCQSSPGQEGGHHDDEVQAHTHSLGGGGVSHRHSISEEPAHRHYLEYTTVNYRSCSQSWYYFTWYLYHGTLYNNMDTESNHTHTLNGGGTHSHTLENPSGGVAVDNKNRPYSEAVSFIKRYK